MLLNPPDDYLLAAGDEVIVIAEDDDTYAPRPTAVQPPGSLRPPVRAAPSNPAPLASDAALCCLAVCAPALSERSGGRDSPEQPEWKAPPKANDNVLLLGWRRDLFDMLHELDKYVSPGSVVCVLAPVALDDRERLLEQARCASPLSSPSISPELN